MDESLHNKNEPVVENRQILPHPIHTLDPPFSLNADRSFERLERGADPVD